MCNSLPVRVPVVEVVALTGDMDKAGPHLTHVCQASALSDLAEGGERLAIRLR